MNKPVAMLVFDNTIYVLGAQNNELQRINSLNDTVTSNIPLNTEGFSTGFHRISGTNLGVVSDMKSNKYSIIDLSKGKLLKTYTLNIPIKDIIITNKVKLFE